MTIYIDVIHVYVHNLKDTKTFATLNCLWFCLL